MSDVEMPRAEPSPRVSGEMGASGRRTRKDVAAMQEKVEAAKKRKLNDGARDQRAELRARKHTRVADEPKVVNKSSLTSIDFTSLRARLGQVPKKTSTAASNVLAEGEGGVQSGKDNSALRDPSPRAKTTDRPSKLRNHDPAGVPSSPSLTSSSPGMVTTTRVADDDITDGDHAASPPPDTQQIATTSATAPLYGNAKTTGTPYHSFLNQLLDTDPAGTDHPPPLISSPRGTVSPTPFAGDTITIGKRAEPTCSAAPQGGSISKAAHSHQNEAIGYDPSTPTGVHRPPPQAPTGSGMVSAPTAIDDNITVGEQVAQIINGVAARDIMLEAAESDDGEVFEPNGGPGSGVYDSPLLLAGDYGMVSAAMAAVNPIDLEGQASGETVRVDVGGLFSEHDFIYPDTDFDDQLELQAAYYPFKVGSRVFPVPPSVPLLPNEVKFEPPLDFSDSEPEALPPPTKRKRSTGFNTKTTAKSPPASPGVIVSLPFKRAKTVHIQRAGQNPNKVLRMADKALASCAHPFQKMTMLGVLRSEGIVPLSRCVSEELEEHRSSRPLANEQPRKDAGYSDDVRAGTGLDSSCTAIQRTRVECWMPIFEFEVART